MGDPVHGIRTGRIGATAAAATEEDQRGEDVWAGEAPRSLRSNVLSGLYALAGATTPVRAMRQTVIRLRNDRGTTPPRVN